MMSKLLGHKIDVLFFFDDILIFNDIWEEHMKSLEEIFGILHDNNLSVRPKKSEVGFYEISYIGHLVGGGCLKPLSDNV